MLSRARPGQGSSGLSFGDDVCALPAKLLAAGYRVEVITRAPRAYASTRIARLRLDTELRAASANETTLGRVCGLLGVEPAGVLYVGDQPQDQVWAARCGTQFLSCPWKARSTDASRLPLGVRATPVRSQTVHRLSSGPGVQLVSGMGEMSAAEEFWPADRTRAAPLLLMWDHHTMFPIIEEWRIYAAWDYEAPATLISVFGIRTRAMQGDATARSTSGSS